MKLKKLFSLLLVVAFLCAAALPLTALAAGAQPVPYMGDEIQAGTDGKALVIGNNATVRFSLYSTKNMSDMSISCLTTGFPITSKGNFPSSVTASADKPFVSNYDITMSMYSTLAEGTYDATVRMYFTMDGTKYYLDITGFTITKVTPSINDPEQPELPDTSAVILDPTADYGIPTAKPGQSVTMVLPLANASGRELTNVVISPKISTSVDAFPFKITSPNMAQALGDMGISGKKIATFQFVVADKATNGTKEIPFTVSYYIGTKKYEYSITAYLTIDGAATTPNPDDDGITPLVLSSKNSKGAAVNTPTGDAGDRVTVVLPIKNRSNQDITQIEIYPQLSSDVSAFPFVIESTGYDRQISKLAAGETKDITYSFRLSDKATSGVKGVKYSVIYRDKTGATHQMEMTSYVNVRKGYEAKTPTVGGDGTPLVVQPKIIITAYQTSKEKVFAGDTFDLNMTIQNASDTETIKNLKLTFASDTGAILPAQGGSNTLFVRSLAPGQSTDVTIGLQSSPDAESKAHSLTVQFDYNNAGVNSFTSKESLSIPIKQELRVTMDEPQIFVDGATVNSSFYGSVMIYNRGKSQVYNVTMKLESENDSMRLEQSFYGGNMQPGASTSADISIIPLQAGDLKGKLVVQYEDEYGEVYEVSREFSAFVQEPFVPDDTMGEYPIDGGALMPEENTGLPTWAIVVIAVVGAAVVITVITIVVKKKRARRERELEA